MLDKIEKDNTSDKSENFLESSLKALKIYELLNIGNNLEDIEISQIEKKIETEKLNNKINAEFVMRYINDNYPKKEEEHSWNEISVKYMILIKEIMNEINKGINSTFNLMRLSASFYLYGIVISEDMYDEFPNMEKIDNFIDGIIISREKYFNILMRLEIIKKDLSKENKKGKIEFYLNIIRFSDKKLL